MSVTACLSAWIASEAVALGCLAKYSASARDTYALEIEVPAYAPARFEWSDLPHDVASQQARELWNTARRSGSASLRLTRRPEGHAVEDVMLGGDYRI